MTKPSLVKIKAKMPMVLDTLEKTLYVAAAEVSALNTPNSSEYKDAMLCQNGLGTNTAEIYFYTCAPEEYPELSQPGFRDIQNDPIKKEKYDLACYTAWKNEVDQVKAIVEKYKGEMKFDGRSLEEYIESHETALSIPGNRVHVRITMPNQIVLQSLRTALEYVHSYEVV